jgi:hypothetical protein
LPGGSPTTSGLVTNAKKEAHGGNMVSPVLLEYAVEMNRLIQLQMEGSVG